MKLGQVYTFLSILLVLIFLLLRVLGVPKEGANKIAGSIMIGAVLTILVGLIILTIIYS